ncbi:Disabled like protein 2-interacting protein [Tupaia chinensis]|uniref:Disabled like protein 2-interacting protein n=1 Tax=Tupaia chinensis TaxID=246437 RepID=L9KQC0_TUPCH|nr:Disabled like protein 2-interacting protein [Tupaia chinensis]
MGAGGAASRALAWASLPLLGPPAGALCEDSLCCRESPQERPGSRRSLPGSLSEKSPSMEPSAATPFRVTVGIVSKARRPSVEVTAGTPVSDTRLCVGTGGKDEAWKEERREPEPKVLECGMLKLQIPAEERGDLGSETCYYPAQSSGKSGCPQGLGCLVRTCDLGLVAPCGPSWLAPFNPEKGSWKRGPRHPPALFQCPSKPAEVSGLPARL